MKWWPEACTAGDMIRVRVGSVWHYGVFISEDEVIEFGPPPSRLAMEKPDFHVMSVDIAAFSGGGIVERAVLDKSEQKRRIPPAQTVALARSYVGEGGYDILHNNCEHFAYRCVFGEGRSTQEETLRERWRSRPILDVFVTRIPDGLTVGGVFPPARQAYIDRAQNEQVRRERYAVWKLLEQGIARSFRLRMEDLRFTEKGGKWNCEGLYFSLSHCRDACAAAVSNAPCGVDIECEAAFLTRHTDSWQKMARRVCTAGELETLQTPSDFLAIWTKKESIYKCGGTGGLLTRKLDTLSRETRTGTLSLPDAYTLSVCGEKPEAARCFLWDGERLDAVPGIF
ncbi:MAG: lecithin retinol acyltransferase family protein [Oscillospiraceae bacterium]|nr:lecithin retinol acyltransferase family protein [Oscillospiraceae bacterium]